MTIIFGRVCQLGVDYAQGYYYIKPESLTDVISEQLIDMTVNG
jgi:EAL domain-containing protein (putative c-di-GMP-specific phosphodiesterase class I)